MNSLISLVQNQIAPQEDAEMFDQHLQTLDETNKSRKELIKQLNTIYHTPQATSSQIYSERVLKDLDFYKSENISIFSQINKTTTVFGEKYLKQLISSPLDDPTLLKERQNRIKLIANNKELTTKITEHLATIKDTEKTLLWFWNPPSEASEQLHQLIYYKFGDVFDHINENTLFMQLTNLYKIFAMPAITTLSPIVTLVLPYIFLKLLGKEVDMSDIYSTLTSQISKVASKFSFGLADKPSPIIKYLSIAMWVVFYLQSAYFSIMSAYNTHKIINNIHTKTNKVAKFISSHQALVTLFTTEGCKTENLQSQCTLSTIFDNPTFRSQPGLFSNKGLILTSYYKLQKSKDQLIPAMQLIGEIDAYMSIIKLTTATTTNNYSFTDFRPQTESDTPYIDLKRIYHPSLPKKKTTVKNDLNMSTNNPTNLLITGPNKAGKSTYIRSVILAIILSQTLTITNAKSAELTPFSYIDSYLNIPDCEGKESLYEAELNRCFEHLTKVQEFKTKKHKYMFTIMDEIFSSTNNREGYAAAYAILKHLSKYNNSASLITTHYYDLSKLESITENKIHNYKFSYTTDPKSKSKTPIFNYKINRGASDQYIALQLLKDKGFDNEIIEDAYKVFNNKKDSEAESFNSPSSKTKRVSKKIK